MVAKYLPLPVSVAVSRWQNVGHRLIAIRHKITDLTFYTAKRLLIFLPNNQVPGANKTPCHQKKST